MKKNLTELVFILDRSGSMQGLEGDTIGGFNAMIGKQKKKPGEAFVSTVLFDDQTEVDVGGEVDFPPLDPPDEPPMEEAEGLPEEPPDGSWGDTL